MDVGCETRDYVPSAALPFRGHFGTEHVAGLSTEGVVMRALCTLVRDLWGACVQGCWKPASTIPIPCPPDRLTTGHANWIGLRECASTPSSSPRYSPLVSRAIFPSPPISIGWTRG